MKWSINMVLCAAPCDKEATSTCWQRREKYLKAFGKSESSDSGGRRQNQQAKGKEECLEQTTVYVILWAAGTMRYLAVWQKVNNALIYTKRSLYNVLQLKISKNSGWNFNFLKIVVQYSTFFLEIMVEIHNTGYCNITDTLLLPCIGR